MSEIYKKEMKQMLNHRKAYLPIVEKLLMIHRNRNSYEVMVKFTEVSEILILAELIDIGYLNPKVVVADKSFESINKIIYTKEYPLTEKGDIYYRRELEGLQLKVNFYRRIKFWLIIALSAIMVYFLIYYFFKKTIY